MYQLTALNFYVLHVSKPFWIFPNMQCYHKSIVTIRTVVINNCLM